MKLHESTFKIQFLSTGMKGGGSILTIKVTQMTIFFKYILENT